MPKLKIDGIEVEVPAGTNVLEAAKKVGITIPHFCYHPALGSVGACRLCAMKFVEGPVKGVQMSCMVTAADGMVVSTTDGESARLRRMVIEWLMINHPHDCPVCDEGGMCVLQDYTVSGGHGRRRYRGKKRVFSDQYLGEFIFQEMNRCIQCYRCARFYQDYAGGDDFGPQQIANKVFFGRFKEGWLDSEFSGNLADVCPTGVFTDRTYRFKSRLWELETAPSVCPHCSLGCNTVPGAKLRELLRVTARENMKVNGWFICDRGRFGYGYASHAERPHRPTAYGLETDFGSALKVAADRIFEALNAHGPHAVAFMGSPRSSLESNFAIKRLADAVGSTQVCFSADPFLEGKDRRAVSRLKPGLSRSLNDVEGSDVIIAAGVDPLNEAPMLALLMRQAVRSGASVTVIDPRPVKLPFKFTHITTPPEDLADALGEAVKEQAGGCARPTIITGSDIGDDALIDEAALEAETLKASGKDCGLIYVMAGPNSFGTAMLAGDGPDFGDVLDGIEKGRIKALVVAGSDPLGQYPDRLRVKDAFSRLETLIVMDYLPTETVKAAHVLLPSTAPPEEEGVFVNNEGRAQAYKKAYTAGIPVNRMGPAAHPPRDFNADVPGAARPVWQLANDLACLLKPDCRAHLSVQDIRQEMASNGPLWIPLTSLDPEGEGEVLDVTGEYSPPGPAIGMEPSGSGLMLLLTELTFGTEELSIFSDKAMLKAPEPHVMISTDDAARLGLSDGEEVTLEGGNGSLVCRLRVSDNVAGGVAVLPRLPIIRASGIASGRVGINRI